MESSDHLLNHLYSGKIGGKGATRCHDGKVLSFRARCNKVGTEGQFRLSFRIPENTVVFIANTETLDSDAKAFNIFHSNKNRLLCSSKVVECNGGEDEYDCNWHKRSSIPTINSVEEFQR